MMQKKIVIGKIITKEMAVALVFSSIILEEFVRAVLKIIGIGNNSFIGLINVMMCAIALVIFVIDSKNHRVIVTGKLIRTSLIFFAMVFLWVLSVAFFKQEIPYINSQFIRFFPLAMIYFYSGTVKINHSLFIRYLRPMIPIAIMYGVLTILYERMDVIYLNLAYNILPWIVIAHILFCQKKRLFILLEMSALIGMLVLSGARMPLLCMIFYFFAVIFCGKKVSKNSMLVTMLVILFFGFFIICNKFDGIRSIEMLLDGSFFKSSERIVIYKYLISEIIKEPFNIRGLYADRILLGNEFVGTNGLGFYLGVEARNSVYAHNLIIEILTDCGMALGIVVLCPLGLLMIKVAGNLRRNSNLSERYFGLLMIVTGLVPLLVSSSLLVNFSFWMMLGWLVTICSWKYVDEY